MFADAAQSVSFGVTRRSIIRHITAIILALAFVAGTGKVHADFVTYNMTGFISNANGSPLDGGGNADFKIGDRINWTLQYDNSTPAFGSSSTSAVYNPNSPTITNIVDQTTGYHFFIPASTSLQSSLGLSNSTGSGQVSAGDISSPNTYTYQTFLFLSSSDLLPTLNLADLQLNNITPSQLSLNYSYYDPMSIGSETFTATTAPEPQSLTHFLLGIACLGATSLTGRRFRFRSTGAPATALAACGEVAKPMA